MAATLYFSNRIEKLADRLAENLRLTDQAADPFEPIQIIVPNANLAKWLQLALSRRQLVVFNLQFVYLEEGLVQMVSRMVSSIGQQSDSDQFVQVRLLDVEQRALQVLYALKNMALDNSVVAPVYRYLFEQGGAKRPDFELRIWQLSRRLALLFQEYEYHRAAMIEQWVGEKPLSGADFSETALCQRAIYRWICRHRQKISADVTFKETFFDYASAALTYLPKAELDERLSEWHFFGLSHLSRFHLELMGRLQPYFPMNLYTLNPSREFWEDLPSATELRYRSQKGTDLSEFPVEHALLSVWGRPGRETVKMLCELTGYAIQEEFSQRFPETVLGRLQQSFLTLSSPDSDQRLPQDRSIQIAACPGKRREVETVYNTILHNLAEDDDLNLTDIAVLVPDMAEYLPYIELVFSGSARQMAYNLVDSGAGGHSLYGQAVMGLFTLIETQLNRKAVFALLQNPCVMHRFKITHQDLVTWTEWVTALGIFKVPGDHAKKDSPKEWATRLFGWQQGLMRLRLGRIFMVTEDKPPKGVDHYQSLEPYVDIQSSDPDSVERFCQVMETLFDTCDQLQRPVKNTLEWAHRIQRICQAVFAIPPEFPDENGVRTRLFQALTDLDQYEQMGRAGLEKSTLPLGLNDVRNYLKTAVTHLKGGRGDYLTSGVTIAELAPMRPIPFKIIFVLGLEAGSFPGRSDASALDLRRVKRQSGDVTLPERQRYLFLEILLSVREKLYLTYVSQDLDKDRELAPGSVLIQLRHYIENHLLPTDTPFEIERIPLSGYSAKYFSPEAASRKTDLLVNKSVQDRMASYGFHHLWPKVLGKGALHHLPGSLLAVYGFDDLWRGAKKRQTSTKIQLKAAKDISPADGTNELTLDELRWFLLDPVGQAAKRQLGGVDQDPLRNLNLGSEDEPLYAEFPVDWQIATTVLNRVMEANFSDAWQAVDHHFIATELDRVYAEFTRKNSVPQEPFAIADKKTLLAKVRDVSANVHKLFAKLQNGSQKYRRFVLGQALSNSGSDIGSTDIFTDQAAELVFQKELDSNQSTVSLSGSQDFIWQDQEQLWHMLVPMAYEKKDYKFPKQLINAALFYLAAKAGKVLQFERAKGLNLYLAAANGLFRTEFSLDANQAQAYLGQLISDYQSSGPPLWLPWKIVQDLPDTPFDGAPEKIDDGRRQDFKRTLTDKFDNDPPEKIGLLQPVITDDVLDHAVQRFAVFPKLEKVNADDL